MTARRAKRKRKKTGEGSFIFGTLSFVVICAALIFAISVFFRVSNIEVSGAERYSAEEIIEASGIKEGASLVTLNCRSAADRVTSELIYAGRVQINRKMPNTVVITIRESDTVACVETDVGLWLIDNYCRLLEPVTKDGKADYIEVSGVSAVSPKAGSGMSVAAEDKSKVTYLEEILRALSDADIMKDVTSIDVSNTANARIDYLGRFKVKLGRNENTEYKLGLLKSAVAELTETEKGTFDLSENKKAGFSPD